MRKKNQPEAKNLVMMAPESDGFGFLTPQTDPTKKVDTQKL